MPPENYQSNENDSEEKKEITESADATLAPETDKILSQCISQLEESRKHKAARMAQILENRNLYNGICQKSVHNPFNECFPFMAGFVDHMKSKIDDDSTLSFITNDESDFKRQQKVQGMYDKVSSSPEPCDAWNIKHRYSKYNAMFSGVAIEKYYSVGMPYKSYLEVINENDFHCEPRGGGMIENHLFCGQDNIFKNAEALSGEKYNQANVKKLTEFLIKNPTKEQSATVPNASTPGEALGLQQESNNYVGQGTIKLVEWYTTYKNVRYYVLFHEDSRSPLRCVKLEDMFPNNNYPYVIWHTNEDAAIFWSKAPCDDARVVANIINHFINQELYNREKNNYGQRAYDPDMFPNVASLSNWRPDGLVPFDSKNGLRQVSQGLYEFKVGNLNGTLDLVSWLESFTGKQMGNTAGSQGDAGKNKQATVFLGEIRQVEQLIGVKNKSFRDALSRLGTLFIQGLEMNLDEETAIKVMGPKGIEWTTISKEDLKFQQPLSIIPSGGTGELELKKVKADRKLAILSNANLLKTVNPQWRDREMLLLQEWTAEEVKEAFASESFTEKELLSEAAEAERVIVEGGTPPLNKGATVAFMQHILDFAYNTNRGEIGELPQEIFNKLLDYANAHVEIVVNNMNREAKELIAKRAKARLSTSPEEKGLPPENIDSKIMSDGVIPTDPTVAPENIGAV